ncbi:hypothetical protein PQO01_19205 [Lentisphaera marina]|uniref:SPFH domain-containing protein n=1 Tax=Lentisphaera marina TaxID=1111041 RepID=UPI002365570C|nr:SPFH domain-containing protein [Lentisphaera marina]MDD7987084.1 hypothetical protein [Lentisphaera marina]
MSQHHHHEHGDSCGHDHHEHDENCHHHHEPPQEQQTGEAEKAVGKALTFIFTSMRFFMLVLLFFVIRSGYFTVESGQQVITFKFKEIMMHDGEGFIKDEGSVHLILPKPFGEVLKFSSAHTPQLVSSSSFWPSGVGQALGASAQAGDSTADLMMGNDGYVLTADQYLYHIKGHLTYRVVNPVRYYKSFYSTKLDAEEGDKRARQVLTNIIDRTLAFQSSKWSVDQAHYTRQNEFMQVCLDAIRKEVSALNLGIECDRFDIKPEDRKPIAQLSGSFTGVSRSITDANKRVSKAQEEKAKIISQARQDAYASEKDAEVFKSRLISSLKNRSEKFSAFLSVYDKKNPEKSILPLYMTSLSHALQNVENKFIISGSDDPNNQIRIKLSPFANEDKKGGK